ncbi:MAG: hypothetical protein AAFR70_12450 [Pseudomonadota bacterium]
MQKTEPVQALSPFGAFLLPQRRRVFFPGSSKARVADLPSNMSLGWTIGCSMTSVSLGATWMTRSKRH